MASFLSPEDKRLCRLNRLLILTVVSCVLFLPIFVFAVLLAHAAGLLFCTPIFIMFALHVAVLVIAVQVRSIVVVFGNDESGLYVVAQTLVCKATLGLIIAVCNLAVTVCILCMYLFYALLFLLGMALTRDKSTSALVIMLLIGLDISTAGAVCVYQIVAFITAKSQPQSTYRVLHQGAS